MNDRMSGRTSAGKNLAAAGAAAARADALVKDVCLEGDSDGGGEEGGEGGEAREVHLG